MLLFAINGDFDDCQHLVKLLHDEALQNQYQVTTGNSINLARLLARVPIAYASTQWREQHKTPMNIIVPAAIWGMYAQLFGPNKWVTQYTYCYGI